MGRDGLMARARRFSLVKIRTAALAGLALLSACAAPQGFLVPVAETAPGATVVPILAATNRGRAPEGSGLMFSGQREMPLSYARVDVSIPPAPAHKPGRIQWPSRPPGNPATDFVTTSTAYLGPAEFTSALGAEMRRRGQGHVLLFVHGYNNSFEDAVYRLAQLAHDSRMPAVPVLFTWPSRGQVLQYPYDRASTDFSRDALEQTLAGLAADPQVKEITILAHSMGCWLTLEALRQKAIGSGRIGDKIRTVILASADVDVDVFKTQIQRLGTKRPQMVMFVSENDEALQISQRFWGGVPRVGAIDPEVEPYRSELRSNGIVAYNLTALRSRGDLGHDKFDLPDVARFIGLQLASGQPIAGTGQGFSERLETLAGNTLGTVTSAGALVLTAPESIASGLSRQP
jgi:esterase/lipase superfamily enzyme